MGKASPIARREGPAYSSLAGGGCEHRDHELDKVTLDGSQISLIGEAKYTAKQRALGDLNRLEYIRDLVGRGVKTPTKLAVYAGRGGFHQDLVEVAARRDDVALVGLDRLYHGD